MIRIDGVSAALLRIHLRRSRLQPEFAFEFLAFAGFLGSPGGAAELEASEGIASALAETSASDSMVFSWGTPVLHFKLNQTR